MTSNTSPWSDTGSSEPDRPVGISPRLDDSRRSCHRSLSGRSGRSFLRHLLDQSRSFHNMADSDDSMIDSLQELCASNSTHQNEQRGWKLASVIPRIFFSNHNRRPDCLDSTLATTGVDEEKFHDSENRYPNEVVKKAKEEGVESADKPTNCIKRIVEVFSSCPSSIVSYVIIFTDEGSTDSWVFNWKNIGWCLSVIVFIEVCLVVGLLIVFFMQ